MPTILYFSAAEIPMKSGRANGEVKGLVFQAADENEFHEWLKVVGSSASGNPRVFGKAETGKLSHVTMNLKVNDHIIGKLMRNSKAVKT